MSCGLEVGWFWVGFGIGFGFGSSWVSLSGKVGFAASELVSPSLIRRQVSKWGVYRCPSLSEVKHSEIVA